jgi:hypothetical protein
MASVLFLYPQAFLIYDPSNIRPGFLDTLYILISPWISLPELDVGDAWELESDDGMSCYGEDSIRADFDDDDVPNDVITVHVDRKSSTGSQVKILLMAI